MKHFAIVFASSGFVLSLFAMNYVTSQQAVAPASHPQPVGSIKKIGFRAPAWKTLHIHNATEAAKTLEVLQRLGCQAAQNEHNGHTDVRYICPKWKTLSVDSDAELAQWQKWLTGKGLETVVINPSADMSLSTVQFRLTEMQRAHLHDETHVQSLSTLYEMIGCQVNTASHNGHTDLTVRCPDWITIGLPNCKMAHQWQAFLNQNGFETHHSH